jgi:hypothetical protein
MNPDTSCSGVVPPTEGFSLSSFVGQTVTLRFEATSTGANQAIANFDDLFVGAE